MVVCISFIGCTDNKRHTPEKEVETVIPPSTQISPQLLVKKAVYYTNQMVKLGKDEDYIRWTLHSQSTIKQIIQELTEKEYETPTKVFVIDNFKASLKCLARSSYINKILADRIISSLPGIINGRNTPESLAATNILCIQDTFQGNGLTDYAIYLLQFENNVYSMIIYKPLGNGLIQIIANFIPGQNLKGIDNADKLHELIKNYYTMSMDVTKLQVRELELNK